jgi:hypothetical protein
MSLPVFERGSGYLAGSNGLSLRAEVAGLHCSRKGPIMKISRFIL